MKVLITAGPTREPIDPVRFLSNRSSGKMGFALAEAAAATGHEVLLISGPVNLSAPGSVRRIDVETAQEMHEAVLAEIHGQDSAILCAAVADYRPAKILAQKLKKTGEQYILELERTPDILGSLRKVGFGGILVGFAAETEDLEDHARDKLHRKGCDLIVANDVGRSDIGFDRNENEVLIVTKNGATESIAKRDKREIARIILDRVERLNSSREDSAPG